MNSDVRASPPVPSCDLSKRLFSVRPPRRALRSDASPLRVHARTLRGGAAAGRRWRRRRRPGQARLGAPGERRTERVGRVGSRSLASKATTVAFAEQSGRGRTPWEYAQECGHETRMALVLRPVPWPCLSWVMGSGEERKGRGLGKEKKRFWLQGRVCSF